MGSWLNTLDGFPPQKDTLYQPCVVQSHVLEAALPLPSFTTRCGLLLPQFSSLRLFLAGLAVILDGLWFYFKC